MNKEQKFWQQMKKSFGLDLMKRVENSIEPGFPDVHYLHNGFGGWIELKAQAKFPNSIDFEPAQPLWLTKYWAAGGDCFLFLKVIEEQKVYVWAGCHAMKLDEKGGARAIPPLFVFDMDEKGWSEICDWFGSFASFERFLAQKP